MHAHVWWMYVCRDNSFCRLVFACVCLSRAFFLCCMRTHAPYISLSIFSHINLKKDVQERKKERERESEEIAAMSRRCCACIRCWSTPTWPSCTTMKHFTTFVAGTWISNAQPTPIWTGGFGCVPCFDDAHICWFGSTLIIRCGLHHRKYVLDSSFQSGYGSKLVTPIIGHPLVNVYITMEHHRFN